MPFSRIARPALAAGIAALALGLTGAGGAQAQAFGTDGEAGTHAQSLDSNGVHPAGNFDCLGGASAWCGAGTLASSTGFSSANLDQRQGFISGSVLATNAEPPARIRSAADVDGHWFDTFTVESATLPADAIVNLMMSVNLQVDQFTASFAAPPPYTNVIASINLGGPDAPAIAGMNVFGAGSYSAEGFLQVQVGVPFVLWATYFSQTNVNEGPVPDLGSTAGFANYHVDILGLANLHGSSALIFGSQAGFDQTSDLHMLTASGHDYSTLPPSGVPEPAAWAMLVAGLGLVGAMARRRRPVAA